MPDGFLALHQRRWGRPAALHPGRGEHAAVAVNNIVGTVVSIGAMRGSYTLSFTSELDASMASVWEVVGTMKGVNAELAPWLRMTAPPEASNLRIEDAPVGRPMFASWVLLRGVLPIDRHSLMLAQIEPGQGFVEDSTSWSQRRWEHRRHLDPRGERACILTDRLTFTPRLGWSGPILARVIGAVFRHRHRMLRERFGSRAP